MIICIVLVLVKGKGQILVSLVRVLDKGLRNACYLRKLRGIWKAKQSIAR